MRKGSKNHWSFSWYNSFWKTFFPDCFTTFRYQNVFSCMIFKNILSFACVFKFFLKKFRLYPIVSVQKKNPLKSKWFSLLCPFASSSWFVRSLCVFSLCLLLLVVTLLIENCREKNLVSYCSHSQIFPRKIFLCLVPFSSFEEKHFCEQLLLFLVLSVFFEKKLSEKNLPYFLKKKKLFFITFCFCSSRFSFTSVFLFRFCLIFGFFLSPSSWIHFSFTSRSSVFFQQQFLLPVVFFFLKKKIFKYPFYMHGLPLDVLLLKHFSKSQKNLFVHFLFWCTFSCVFVFACLSFFFLRFSFFCFIIMFFFETCFFFCSRSWMFFSVGPFLLISFFGFSVWFDHRFFSPSYFPFFTKKQCVLNCFLL